VVVCGVVSCRVLWGVVRVVCLFVTCFSSYRLAATRPTSVFTKAIDRHIDTYTHTHTYTHIYVNNEYNHCSILVHRLAATRATSSSRKAIDRHLETQI